MLVDDFWCNRPEDPGQDQQKAADHADVEAKYNLASSLLWSGKAQRAIVAFETALKFQPAMIRAHRWLATTRHMQVLYVDCPNRVQSPHQVLPRIDQLLGRALLPQPEGLKR